MPRSPVVEEAIRRARERLRAQRDAELGVSRRSFLMSVCGAATTLLALNVCSDEANARRRVASRVAPSTSRRLRLALDHLPDLLFDRRHSGTSGEMVTPKDVGRPVIARCLTISSMPLHPAYFETVFDVEGHPDWPYSFAIITAWATTGQTWTQEENEAADQRLRAALGGSAIARITGRSPTTGHAEPGWAAGTPFEAALHLARAFHQDALYIVEADTLYVVGCEDPKRARVGGFRERIH